MITKRIRILTASLCVAMLALAGCNDFERTSFQTLSASKAVIDQAQVEYEARTIPHGQASFDLITKAKQAQTTGVDAMLAYESIKAAKGPAASLQAQQQVVVAALAGIVPLIADIKLMIAPAKAGAAKAIVRPSHDMAASCADYGTREPEDEGAGCPPRIILDRSVFSFSVRYAI